MPGTLHLFERNSSRVKRCVILLRDIFFGARMVRDSDLKRCVDRAVFAVKVGNCGWEKMSFVCVKSIGELAGGLPLKKLICEIPGKEIEYPLDVDDCERHYFQARIAPFEDNKVMALIHDIGDRVQRSNELIEAKQRAEEADRMKSVFLANMSHEIRTPLNAIVGFSEIIALTEDEVEKAEYLNIIQKNSNLLLQLINDILDLSRIESGKSEMNFQLVEMTGLRSPIFPTQCGKGPECHL